MNQFQMNTRLKNSEAKIGINLVGTASGEHGLGEAVRGTLRSLNAADVAVIVKNIEADRHRNQDETYKDFFSEEKNLYPINLIHINPDNELYRKIGSEYFQDKYNIGCWSWELPQLPPAWISAFDLFDEIWTPSNYSADSISRISPIPVIKIPHSIELAKPKLERESLGIPKDKFIFLFMFDFHSTLLRKNTLGLVEAFKQAFSHENQDILLIIKFSNGQYHPEKLGQLRSIVADRSDIFLIEGHLMKAEVQALVYHCDCYISLHRSEGFGLTMAEAMYYGKPVIATGYSSNIEFMNVGNSFLVKYKLVTITESEGSYFTGATWAEPDIDHAASLMRYVYENYQKAQQVGEQAAKDIKANLSPQIIGQKVKKRLEYIVKWQNHSGFISRSQLIHNLRAEKEFFELQSKIWRQTAEQINKEILSKKQGIPHSGG